MANYKLIIPKPCNEAWEGMTPDSDGRFCGQCQKTVTDFTGMSREQINTYLKINSDKKVCGKFNKQQLSPFILHIPETVLYTQRSFGKIFMLALLIVMGATLFSCKDHNNNVIGELVIDTSIEVDTTNYDKKGQVIDTLAKTNSLEKTEKKMFHPQPVQKHEPQTLLGEPVAVPDTIKK